MKNLLRKGLSIFSANNNPQQTGKTFSVLCLYGNKKFNETRLVGGESYAL